MFVSLRQDVKFALLFLIGFGPLSESVFYEHARICFSDWLLGPCQNGVSLRERVNFVVLGGLWLFIWGERV